MDMKKWCQHARQNGRPDCNLLWQPVKCGWRPLSRCSSVSISQPTHKWLTSSHNASMQHNANHTVMCVGCGDSSTDAQLSACFVQLASSTFDTRSHYRTKTVSTCSPGPNPHHPHPIGPVTGLASTTILQRCVVHHFENASCPHAAH